MIRCLSFVVGVLALAGCDLLRLPLMDPVEKINEAFTLPAGLQEGQAQLVADPALSAGQAEALRDGWRLRLQERASICSKNLVPGAFDSLDDLRRRITDTGCFHTHDLALQDWVGLHRFRLAMGKPPLVPLTPLPARSVLPQDSEPGLKVIAARAANVAVLRRAQGPLTTIGLPNGRVLGRFAGPTPGGAPAALSPNGRVLAVPVADALRMIDSLSGDTLWTSTEFTAVQAWLPAIEATLLARRDGAGVALLDLRDGAVRAHPLDLPALTWSVPAPALGKSRQVMGNASVALVVDHARHADGSIGASLVEQRDFPGRGLAELPPLLMAEGQRLVYSASGDLGWLDLATGDSGMFNLSPLQAQSFMKNSESTLLVELGRPDVRGPRLLDVNRATLGHIEGPAPTAALAPLAGRNGWVGSDGKVSLGYGLADDGVMEPIGQVIAGKGAAASP